MGEKTRLRPSERDAKVSNLASRQRGVIHRDQAEALGVTARMRRNRVKSGQWVELFPGVFRLAAAPPTAEQRVLAACLWGKEGTVASHRTAAALWGLEGYAHDATKPIELTSTRDLRRPSRVSRRSAGQSTRRPGVLGRALSEFERTLGAPRSPRALSTAPASLLVHRSRRPRLEVMRNGIPVTSLARTLLDLCAVEPERAEHALNDALRRRWVSLPDLQALYVMEEPAGTRGLARFRSLVERLFVVGGATDSWLETKTARVLAQGGFAPLRQHGVRAEGHRYRVDFAFPEERVVVEAQGYRFHHSVEDWSKDQARQSALAGAGWRVLLTTAEELKRRPHALLERLRALGVPCRRVVGRASSGP